MTWIQQLLNWADANEALLWWLFATSVALFLLAPIAAAWFVIQLPSDYFAARRRQRRTQHHRHPAMAMIVRVAKNVLGGVLLVAGLVMLVAPGQGLLTLAVALVLLDFPGKYRLERWAIRRRPVWRSINWLRKRAGRPPLDRPQKH